MPLVASGEMFGLLNVEYPRGATLADDDEPVTIPLANQLSVALRNLHLLGEARYYRDYLRKMIDVANALIIVIDRDANVAVMNATMQRYSRFGAGSSARRSRRFRKRSTAPEPRLSTLLDGRVARRRVQRLRSGAVARATRHARARHVQHVGLARAPTATSTASSPSARTSSACARSSGQVIQAEKLATLGQLAAGVVHELNNPLTSISVYGDYLVRLLERDSEKGDSTRPTRSSRARPHPEADARSHELRAAVGRVRVGR